MVDKERDVNAEMTGDYLESLSYNAVLAYLKSEKRKPFLRAMEKYGYELRVIQKGQCY